jgi:hypothetical protein
MATNWTIQSNTKLAHLFEDAASPLQDSSSNNNDGVVNGTVSLHQPGKWGYGVRFSNQNNDYISFGSDASLDNLSQISICVYAYNVSFGTAGAASDAACIISKGYRSGALYLLQSGNLRWVEHNGNGSAYWDTTNGSVQTGIIQHYAVTFDRSDEAHLVTGPKIYVNGVQQTVVNNGVNPTAGGVRDDDSGQSFILGLDDAALQTGELDSYIDELLIYNGVLSAADISEIMNNGIDGSQGISGVTISVPLCSISAVIKDCTAVTNSPRVYLDTLSLASLAQPVQRNKVSLTVSVLAPTVSCGATVWAYNNTYRWWNFDEGSGSTSADSSGNGDTVTLVGSPSWVAGKLGYGINLNGTDQYATMSVSSAYSFPKNQVSFGCWIKTTRTAAQRIFALVKNSSASAFGLVMGFNSSGTAVNDGVMGLITRTATDTVNIIRDTVSIADGQWHHVGFVINGTNATLFVDGQSVNTTSTVDVTNTFSFSSSISARFGISPSDTQFFSGSIDSARLFNWPLSGGQVLDLYRITDRPSITATANTVTVQNIGISVGALGITASAKEQYFIGSSPYVVLDRYTGEKVAIQANFGGITQVIPGYTAGSSSSEPVVYDDQYGTGYYKIYTYNGMLSWESTSAAATTLIKLYDVSNLSNVYSLNILNDMEFLNLLTLISPSARTITSSTKAPTVLTNTAALATPSALTITATAQSVTSQGSTTYSGSLCTVTASTQAPTILTGNTISAGLVSLTATAQTATASTAGNVTVSASVLTITSTARTVTVSGEAFEALSVLAITSSVLAPTVLYGVTISPSTLTITSTAQSLSTGGTASVTLSLVSITSTARTATVTADGQVTPSTLTGSLSLVSPSLVGTAVVGVSATTVTSSVQPPTVSAAGNVSIGSNALTVTSSILSPSVQAIQNADAIATLLNLTLAQLAPSLSAGAGLVVLPTTVSVTSTAATTTVAFGVTLTPSAMSMTLAVGSVIIPLNVTISGGLVTITLTQYGVSTTAGTGTSIAVQALSMMSSYYGVTVSVQLLGFILRILSVHIQKKIESRIKFTGTRVGTRNVR